MSSLGDYLRAGSMVRELWKFAYQPLANALKRKSVERLYDVIKGPFPEEIILSLLKGRALAIIMLVCGASVFMAWNAAIASTPFTSGIIKSSVTTSGRFSLNNCSA